MPDRGRNRRAAKRGKRPPAAGSTDPPALESTSPTGCEGWLWWRSGPGSREKPKEDYTNARKIPVAVRAEFDKLRQRYRSGQLRNGANIKYIGDGIYEFKYSHTGNTPYRLLFMRWGKWAIALDVFKKTTNVTPKDVAMQRRRAWLTTFGNTPPE